MHQRLLAVAMLVALSGCAYKNAQIPGAPVPFALADYRVLGATNAEECGTYIFGVDFGHLFTNQGGGASVVTTAPAASTGLAPLDAILGQLQALAALLPSGGAGNAESSRATYHALEKMPEATHLLDPRYHVTSKGVLAGPVVLFGQRCSQVTARGVVIGGAPTTSQDDPWEP